MSEPQSVSLGSIPVEDNLFNQSKFFHFTPLVPAQKGPCAISSKETAKKKHPICSLLSSLCRWILPLSNCVCVCDCRSPVGE